ncbi:MAG TPA: fibronectin type III domain-containing protein [Thermoanaerobaculia bacterium]|jgi:hypothetical protein|nr:fibronectin type III domain-containing protein [Thermoanaerobaculia bacterium]
MKRLLCFTLALATIATIPAAAQTFGELFPLTNTRYRAAFGGAPKLVATNSEFFLFWDAETKVRATRLRNAEPRAGHVILEPRGGYDVAWMGDRFLAVASRETDSLPVGNQIYGQYLDAEARPTGVSFSIIGNGLAPRIARGPESTLLVYRTRSDEVRSLLLDAQGRKIAAADSQRISLFGLSHAVAATANGFVAVSVFANEIRSSAVNRDGNKISEQSLSRGDSSSRLYRGVAIASNGTSYLAVWSSNDEVVTATVDENGAFGAPLVLETQGSPAQPSAVWNGAGWTVSYATTRSQERARVVQLDFTAQRILTTEESAEGIGSPAVAALDGRILAAWRPNLATRGSVSVFELPLAQNPPRVVTYTATQQTLLATASSDEATLVVWREEFDEQFSVRAGVRTHEGRWTERELESGVRSNRSKDAVAASDGRNFAIAVTGQQNSFLYRLDGDGQPTSEPLLLPESPIVMAWNGTHYAMIGASTVAYELRGMLAGPAGALAAPVAIPNVFFNPTVLVSDGNGFLLAGDYNECQFLFCTTESPYGTRLGPDLQRLDAQDVQFSTEGGTTIAGALWNGSEYIVVWNLAHGIRVSRVPATPGGAIETIPTTLTLNGQDLIALSDGTLALVGTEQSRTLVVFLRADGTPVNGIYANDVRSAGREPFLAPLPDGGIAIIASRVQDAAPHHGTNHVMMTIARSTPLPRPDAPHVSARIEGNYISVDWSAPSGTINGYRIEYRVDDGSWNEVDDWYSPGAQHTSIRKPDFGSNFAIRMRAFNDAGASSYSATTITNPSRRRAAR